MGLIKFNDYYKDNRDVFENTEFTQLDRYSVYSGDDKIGSVKDALIDESTGQFRYLVVDTGLWIFGKKVLLPIGLARFSYSEERVYADGLTQQQVENLPEYRDDMTVDYGYEENVRQGYRDLGDQRQFMGQRYSVDGDRTFERPTYNSSNRPSYDEDTYDYEYDASLYARNLDDRDDKLRLYEERLVANKVRQKSGEVSIGKKVETGTATVSVPVEKERIVIERTTPESTPAVADRGAFETDGAIRMDLHEERATSRKETFVREEVAVRKQTDQETVQVQEKVRRETLDVDGNADDVVER